MCLLSVFVVCVCCLCLLSVSVVCCLCLLSVLGFVCSPDWSGRQGFQMLLTSSSAVWRVCNVVSRQSHRLRSRARSATLSLLLKMVVLSKCLTPLGLGMSASSTHTQARLPVLRFIQTTSFYSHAASKETSSSTISSR